MKKWIIIAATVLAALGCTKDQYTDPCTFDLKVTRVKGTKVWISITPSNPNAYYAYSLFSELAEGFDQPATVWARQQLDWNKQVYEAWEDMEQNIGTYADVFCYQGAREIKQTFMASGLRHRFVVMQLNPQTRTVIGTPQEVSFTTKDVERSDLTFSVQFDADEVTITPSQPDATYYWDYDSRDLIEDKYFTPSVFFYSVVDLYEDYDFMPNMVSKGEDTYVFSVNDKDMKEGEECLLVVAGYAGGEINTTPDIYEFVYHKDKPIEYSQIQGNAE